VGVVGPFPQTLKPIMYYVYLIRSLKDASKTYIGYTAGLKQRLKTHNSGSSIHTKQFRPWKLVVYVAFDEEEKALVFEKYIKVGAGYAFAKKRFW
jgi:predicted GIY-YIG superfamily endonuclease